LEEEQEWVRAAAEKLAAALRQRGRQVEIKNAQIAKAAGPWDMDRPVLDGTRLWRGNPVQPEFFISQAVILLGKRGENRLIEALARRDAYLEPLT
ncbi:MAG: hypothetical protein N3A66_06495, partial [Planctomycetota bacterium]|nr:hypothetical protein [Planctomycetota bacterium]